MTYALRVSIEGLSIVEYENTSAWRYDMAEHAQRVWKQAQEDAPPVQQAEGSHGYTLPLQEGVGPQFVDLSDE